MNAESNLKEWCRSTCDSVYNFTNIKLSNSNKLQKIHTIEYTSKILKHTSVLGIEGEGCKLFL